VGLLGAKTEIPTEKFLAIFTLRGNETWPTLAVKDQPERETVVVSPLCWNNSRTEGRGGLESGV
jgi:hypothetical protein